jgi:phospho-N-acetylmuramoyl-pentapeptide-transferase
MLLILPMALMVLAAGVSVIVLITLAIFAYVSGNVKIADYLNVLYIPDSAEVVIVCAALIGATIGFLWYNAFPATVFLWAIQEALCSVV